MYIAPCVASESDIMAETIGLDVHVGNDKQYGFLSYVA